MRFEECKENNYVVKVSRNENRAKSLRKTAEDRIKYIQTQEINSLSCNFILEDYYSALLEIVHSIALVRGYKILNHLCLTSFIEEELEKPRIAEQFDNLRKIRNNLVYYGKRLEIQVIESKINTINSVIEKLKEFY